MRIEKIELYRIVCQNNNGSLHLDNEIGLPNINILVDVIVKDNVDWYNLAYFNEQWVAVVDKIYDYVNALGVTFIQLSYTATTEHHIELIKYLEKAIRHMI